MDEKSKKLVGKPKKISCNFLCVSGGWTPTVNLFSQSRGKLIYRESDATFIPHESFQEEISIGSCNGTFELNEILEETYNKMKIVLNEFGKKIEEHVRGNSICDTFERPGTRSSGR